MHQPKNEDSNAAIKRGMRLRHHAVTPHTNPGQDMSLKQLSCIIASTEPGINMTRCFSRGRLTSKLTQKPQHNAKIVIRFTVLSRGFKAMPSIYTPHSQAFFTENLRVRDHVVASPRGCRRLTRTRKQLEPIIAQFRKTARTIACLTRIIAPGSHGSQALDNISVSLGKGTLVKQAGHQVSLKRSRIRLAVDERRGHRKRQTRPFEFLDLHGNPFPSF